MTAREWLLKNGYDDIVNKIDDIDAEHAKSGSKERRNWWAVLAGGKGGKPLMVADYMFPVLRAAQRRQGKPITPNAIQRNRREVAPAVKPTARWRHTK